MKPLISIIIPVYNCEKYLSDAIECAISQTYNPIEVIIVDDGSTDNSAEIAKSFKENIEYIHQQNSGPASARNSGINMARGEFIAFLDADDLWPLNKLELQHSKFVENKNLSIVMGKIKYEELPGADRKNKINLDPDNTFKYVNLGAGLFKKSVFERVGYFDNDFIYWEDLDWFLRAYEKNESIELMDNVTMIYRIHSDNMSNCENKEIEYFLMKALRNSLKRRRLNKSGKVNPIINFFELSKNNIIETK